MLVRRHVVVDPPLASKARVQQIDDKELKGHSLKTDLPAALVVFLVALPLCLGIALAAGAPLQAGIISGIVGGIVVGIASKAQLSVSGPSAAALGVIIAGTAQLGGFRGMLTAIVLAGLIQLAMGFARAGALANFVPNAVIRGMLAAIGLIVILKQIPHAFGWDADFEGDESFFQPDGRTTLTELMAVTDHVSRGAVIISAVSLTILVVWSTRALQRWSLSKIISGPLVAVLASALLGFAFQGTPGLALEPHHFVALPVPRDFNELISGLTFPDFSAIKNPAIWTIALSAAFISSIEALLSIEAADTLDPFKRITPPNTELKAQGLGNIVSALIGGLPVTAVIIRSTANVNAGARTKLSTILHGILLLAAAALGASALNHIPLAGLATILILTGYRLCNVAVIREVAGKGLDQAAPFFVTIAAILFTDLLRGIGAGLVVGLIFIMRTNFRHSITVMTEGDQYLISLAGSVSFLNKAYLRGIFQKVPRGAYVLIDGTRAGFIDKDIVETLRAFLESAKHRGIDVELKRSPTANNPVFKSDSASVDYDASPVAFT